MTDSLTGLLQRPDIGDALKRHIAEEETVSFISLDIDHFTQVNEVLGREEGDRLLSLVGEALKAAAASGGWIAGRIGGDEFVLILPGVPLEKGFLEATELHRALMAAIPQQFPAEPPISISLGVANYPRDAKDASTLMSKADQTLYQAKESGRNQVALPWNEEMVLRSCYYTTSQLGRLKKLAETRKKKESVLLREALDDLLRKYDIR